MKKRGANLERSIRRVPLQTCTPACIAPRRTTSLSRGCHFERQTPPAVRQTADGRNGVRTSPMENSPVYDPTPTSVGSWGEKATVVTPASNLSKRHFANKNHLIDLKKVIQKRLVSISKDNNKNY